MAYITVFTTNAVPRIYVYMFYKCFLEYMFYMCLFIWQNYPRVYWRTGWDTLWPTSQSSPSILFLEYIFHDISSCVSLSDKTTFGCPDHSLHHQCLSFLNVSSHVSPSKTAGNKQLDPIPPFSVISLRMWLLCLLRWENRMPYMSVNGCHQIFLDIIWTWESVNDSIGWCLFSVI